MGGSVGGSCAGVGRSRGLKASNKQGTSTTNGSTSKAPGAADACKVAVARQGHRRRRAGSLGRCMNYLAQHKPMFLCTHAPTNKKCLGDFQEIFDRALLTPKNERRTAESIEGGETQPFLLVCISLFSIHFLSFFPVPIDPCRNRLPARVGVMPL